MGALSDISLAVAVGVSAAGLALAGESSHPRTKSNFQAEPWALIEETELGEATATIFRTHAACHLALWPAIRPKTLTFCIAVSEIPDEGWAEVVRGGRVDRL